MIGVYVGLNVLIFLLGLLCLGIAATRADRPRGILFLMIAGLVLISAAIGASVTLNELYGQ